MKCEECFKIIDNNDKRIILTYFKSAEGYISAIEELIFRFCSTKCLNDWLNRGMYDW